MGKSCDLAYGNKGLKGGMKSADKRGAKFALVLGDDEIVSKVCQLKLMSNGQMISSTLNASELAQKIGSIQ
jgi:histidyl-tRNA synthetase